MHAITIISWPICKWTNRNRIEQMVVNVKAPTIPMIWVNRKKEEEEDCNVERPISDGTIHSTLFLIRQSFTNRYYTRVWQPNSSLVYGLWAFISIRSLSETITIIIIGSCQYRLVRVCVCADKFGLAPSIGLPCSLSHSRSIDSVYLHWHHTLGLGLSHTHTQTKTRHDTLGVRGSRLYRVESNVWHQNCHFSHSWPKKREWKKQENKRQTPPNVREWIQLNHTYTYTYTHRQTLG